MSETDPAVTVLAGVEAGRRVGWAKAYDYADRLDEASRDVNLLRGDRDAFRKGLSFMFGLFMEWTKNERSAMFRQVLEQVAGFDAVMDGDLVTAGRRKASAIREADGVWLMEKDIERAAKESATKARQKEGRRLWIAAKERALDELAARYGFESIGELEHVLTQWQTATGRKPVDPKTIRDRRHKDGYSRRQAQRESRFPSGE